MQKIITRIYSFFEQRSWTLRITLLLTVVLLAVCALQLHFEEDISNFLPEKAGNERINYAYRHIGAANKMVINISCTNKEADIDLITEAVDTFVNQMNQYQSDGHFTEISYQVDQQLIMDLSQFIAANMPYFLTEADYDRLDSILTPDFIAKQLVADKELAASPAGGFLKGTLTRDPLHWTTPVLQQLQNMQMNDNYQLYNGYIFNKAGTEATITVTSAYPVSETSQNALLLKQIETAEQQTRTAFNGQIKISSIGAAAISIGNARQIKKDSIFSTAIALVLILALLFYFFRDVRAMLIILFSIAFGGLFGLAFLALFRHSVSIIAIGAGSIIVGLAANYPLHFLAHIQQGYSREQTIKDITLPLVTGNITTVGAFLSLLFISSAAMRDFGLFAAMLLVGTILFVLLFLPHLFRKRLFAKNETVDRLSFGRAANFAPEHHKWLVWMIILLTIPLYYFSLRTNFETNMNAINYMTPDQKEKMAKLIQETEDGHAVLYCVAEGENMEEALTAYERSLPTLDSLTANGTTLQQIGIGRLLPSKKLQNQRIELWNSFWATHKRSFLQDFDNAATAAGFVPQAFDPFKQTLSADFQPEEVAYFAPILQNMADNYLSEENGRAMVFSILRLNQEQVNATENQLNTIDNQVFAFDNRSMISKMVDALSDDFNYVLYICGFIVLLFLTISFGRIELSLLSFLPLAISWIWILGLMGLCDMRFNIVNIILATFIFGQGDDYTIFVTEGMMHEYTYGRKMLASYKNSILLSASIMFIGIGVLIFAKHPAMRSLAEVTIVGMFSVVLMAYLFPPLIYRWLTTKKGNKRLMPVTLWNFLKTVYAFTVFLLGSILLTFIGFVLLTIGGKTDKNKILYHKCLCTIFCLLAKAMPGVGYEVRNKYGETFNRPGVIICNHQSHIDLMYTLMLSPKIICLTNHWVWNSPFYGWIIRYADFLPIEDGIEGNVHKLRSFIEKGYSILIFPEGTRSEDCSILRFHKGAFYLAEKLKVDIIPLLVHGIGHALPKTEMMLRKGHVTVDIMERITPEKLCQEGKSVLNASQRIRTLYTKKYAKLSGEIETADYFADLVLHNYIYKGAEIEKEARQLLKNNANFANYIATLPDKGEICINDCGIGVKTLMAALVKKNLHIIATDKHADQLEIARNCTSVPANLTYTN